MNQYQFDKIYSQMGNEFGKIRKGSEDAHSTMLAAIETNALKIHRSNPNSNSRRFREAIALALFDIKSRITNEEIDVDSFRNEDNAKLEQAILMAFDPYTNKKIAKNIKNDMNEEQMRDYYKEPIMCLLRIKDSVDMWVKEYGGDGYFYFLENTIGVTVKGDNMECASSNDDKKSFWQRLSHKSSL